MHFFCFFSLIWFICNAQEVQYFYFNQVFNKTVSEDAIIRDEPGFENDFLIIHSLIRENKPFNIFEIGTCEGKGTRIIRNAMGFNTVYSLELPPDTGPYKIPKERIGMYCTESYVQLFGDSMSYDYSQHFPIDAWFIDGWHDYSHVFYETSQAMRSNPCLIMWHDTDVPEVFEAIIDVLSDYPEYILTRVVDTRMTYAIRMFP